SMHPAISNEIFYIVPEKCTECVGFHDHEACAAVCPVDCCVPNPDIPETHDVLLARARALHPGESIPDDAPSRFKKEGGDAGAAGGAPATPAGGAPAGGAPAAPPRGRGDPPGRPRRAGGPPPSRSRPAPSPARERSRRPPPPRRRRARRRPSRR